MALEPDIEKLAEEIKSCKNILTALGDESRQHLIIAMMQACNCNGLRVGEITERTKMYILMKISIGQIVIVV